MFEKTDVPEDDTEKEQFVGTLMEFGVSLSTYIDMMKPKIIMNAYI